MDYDVSIRIDLVVSAKTLQDAMVHAKELGEFYDSQLSRPQKEWLPAWLLRWNLPILEVTDRP